MKQQHTPGPWIQGCEDFPNSGDIYAEDGSLIAEVFVNGEPESMVANARLIAAAPDLLALLEDWLASFVDSIEGGEADELVEATRKAISKATGGEA